MRIHSSIKFLGRLCLVSLLLLRAVPARGAEVSEAPAAEETYQHYMALFRAAPDDLDVNLRLARAAFAAGHPHQAIMAYERLLVKYPDNQLILRELAGVYSSIGDTGMAESYTETAAGSAAVGGSPGLAASRWRKSARLRLGTFFDSNVNQAAGGEWFNIAGSVYRVEMQEEISSPGLALSGQADVSYSLSEGSPWHLTAGLGFNTRLTENPDLREIDRSFMQGYRTYLGLRRAGASDLFEVRAVFELSDYDFYDTVYSYGAEAVFVRAVTPGFHLITAAGLFDRRYIRNMNAAGTYWHAGQIARFVFGRGGHELTVGGRWFAADTKSGIYVQNMRYDKYSYDGWEAFAAFNFKLGGRFELTPGVTYREKRYRAPATSIEFAGGIDREEAATDLNVGLTYRLNETASVELTYRYIVNSSNSELYEYDRSLLSLGMVWTF